MKVIFMGTPDSVGTLEALIEAGHDVVLAVTQPDKTKRTRKRDAVYACQRVRVKAWNSSLSAEKSQRAGMHRRTSKI